MSCTVHFWMLLVSVLSSGISYAVGGSMIFDFSRKDERRERLKCQHEEVGSSTIWFAKYPYSFIIIKHLPKVKNWQFTTYVKGTFSWNKSDYLDDHFHCSKITMAMHEPLNLLLEFRHWRLPKTSSPWEPPHNKHPHNSSSICCCSQVVTLNILTHLDDILCEFKTLSQIGNRPVSCLRSRLRFLSFFNGALLANFKRIFER